MRARAGHVMLSTCPPVRRGVEAPLIFKQFPELRIGLFGKTESCFSDQECAEQLGFKQVAVLNQVHGNITHVIESLPPSPPNGDGLITATPNLALSIRFADCQTFVMYAPRQKVLGVLHAGWRGMALKAITAHFCHFQTHFGIPPSETYVYAAPSLCAKCAEFSNPLRELPAHLHPFIEGRCMNLRAAAEAEFDSVGAPHAQRERHPACTKCGEGFWSYRRGEKEERNYLIAGISS